MLFSFKKHNFTNLNNMIITQDQAFKLMDDLYLTTVKYSIEENKISKIPIREKKLLTFILDVSGSMYSQIKKLKDFSKMWLRQLEPGDGIQFIWFTSHGQFLEFQTPTIIPNGVTEQFFSEIEKTIEKELYARNLTGFDTPLQHFANSTIPMLNRMESIYGGLKRIVIFCSDGFHNNGSKSAIFDAINKMKDHISQFYTIGFGNYCDEDLLKEMKNASGCGIYAFVQDAEEMNVHINSIITETVIGEGHIVNRTINKDDINFAIFEDGKVVSLNADSNAFRVTGNEVLFCSLTKNIPTNLIEVRNEEIVKATYASSIMLLENKQTKKAIKILSNLKDRNLAELCYLSNTKEQYAFAINQILFAISDSAKRFIGGKNEFGTSIRKTQLFILKWLEDNGFEVSSNKPDGYKEIGLKAEYSNPGDVVIINGETKVIPYIEDVTSEFQRFRLEDYPFDTLNINYQITRTLNVLLKDEHKDVFDGASKISNIPLVRAYNIIDSSGNNSLKFLTVKAPSLEKLNEGITLGIFAPNAVNLVQNIYLNKFPVSKIDWDSDNIDTIKYATKLVELQRVKMEMSIYDREKKKLPILKQQRFTEEQINLAKSEYFVDSYSTGTFGYNPPKKYHENLDYNKKPGVKELEGSNTDFNIFYIFDSSVSIVDGNTNKKFESVPTLNEAYINKLKAYSGNMLDKEVAVWYNSYLTESAELDNDDKLSFLKLKISKMEKQKIKLLNELMDIKLDIIYGKKEFENSQTREISVNVDLDGKTYNVSMSVGIDKAYCGKYAA